MSRNLPNQWPVIGPVAGDRMNRNPVAEVEDADEPVDDGLPSVVRPGRITRPGGPRRRRDRTGNRHLGNEKSDSTFTIA